MSQVCAAEGCTHERTVLWQPWLCGRPKRKRAVPLYSPGHEQGGLPNVPLCADHEAAVMLGTAFQFKHESCRYTFDGKEIVPYATTRPG